ncbi:hypothetical protein AXL51_004624 [Salmonella enterica subsp. enterica serovar 4,[5],12:i:-]|nr:hypothetical protein [Salmonella enterica subsp. enterica serovar 4,[5],12:i:-]
MGRWWRYKWITFHPSLTQYENIDTKVEIKVTLRQELIESVSRFDFDVYQQFLERKKEFKEKPVRVPFSKRL